ncbi:T9SS type A sorting domain-containing protein [Lacinutrix iliipiscaria]|uniref:T9SS type A sorting domain-containing protein n=1 Tax=Lacinutrix iliipiscaria TaxID=1230532 RepID=A0ABW5WQM6_9FLAO
MKKHLAILFISILSLNSVSAQDTFKAMFYNLLNFPLQTIPENRIDYLREILIEAQPDIFMVCELNNETGANSIITMIQSDVNSNYESAVFMLNTSDDDFGDQNDLQNLLFFDSSKFSLENQNAITTVYRDFNHYTLKLNTVDQDINPLFLEVIVGHLKSSDGSENQAIRLEMVQDLTSYLNTLPEDSHVLLGGDLNLYRSSEDAFQELINTTNVITFVDPANKIGSWHNNTNFIEVFTQSTRTTTGMGGATGGFDDRFDFILTSESMEMSSENPNPDLYFVDGSYEVFGNNSNSNCYNQAITSTDCGEDGDVSTPDYSEDIRNELFNFSDHLPVILQIEANQLFLSVPEYTTANYYEIIGTNIISNTLNLQTNNQLLTTKKLNIFNTLGQLVMTLAIDNAETHYIDVSHLSSGLYYITTPNLHVEPLKFVKVN